MKTTTLLTLAAGLFAGAALLTGCADSHDHAKSDTSTKTAGAQKVCPVSGEKLGSMGTPFEFTYKGQKIKLCCDGCKDDFDKDPQKYLAKMPK